MNDKNRTKTRIAVLLVGVRNNSVLLGKRIHNTHMGGYWGVPGGHVYEGEPASKALIREIKEECGITLPKSDIEFRGAMHHSSDTFDYANYIFKVDLTNHEPTNKEPDKCESLEFFDINNLPEKTVPYVKLIIEKTLTNNHPWIIEHGWE